MIKNIYFLISLILIVCNSSAQQPVNPCSLPEASQFDFWIGSWDLTWNDTIHGTNNILKIMNGCTVNENFSSPSTNYHGSSWSVFNPNTKMWQQTWVDDGGAYISLTGKYENGMMTLSTSPRKMADGKTIIFRMVFYDITPNKFKWRWEATTDEGKSWTINWLINYSRRV